MKKMKLIFGFSLLAILLTSCYTEVVVEDPYVDPFPVVTLREVLSDYELWYVDVNQTTGNGYVPFLQKAFTVSFRNGTLFANNNLVGFGSQGGGFGIQVGYFDTSGDFLNITHDLDGYYSFEVTPLSNGRIELYFPQMDLSYILIGYQRSTFDYNAIFYDNIHYFLQEYTAWEKTFTSVEGMQNEFDYENFIAFLPGGGAGNFLSSQDGNGTNINNLYWDYTGIYNVDPVPGNNYLKYLTLDYDYLGNEYFELSVINDNTIALFHNASGTLYRFKGKGYIQFKNKDGKLRLSNAEIAKQMIKISNF